MNLQFAHLAFRHLGDAPKVLSVALLKTWVESEDDQSGANRGLTHTVRNSNKKLAIADKLSRLDDIGCILGKFNSNSMHMKVTYVFKEFKRGSVNFRW